MCKDASVRQVVNEVESGITRIAFHLDLVAEYEDASDKYARLAYAVRDSGGFTVNEPDHARLAGNKAVVHYRFERAGIPVPYTVVVRNWEPRDFVLTPSERKKLGRPFVIKPARGYGKLGVAVVDGGSVNEMARVRRYDKGDDFLVQQLVEPLWFGHRQASGEFGRPPGGQSHSNSPRGW
jgi:glutathione synthase/RimK-type ligase-like ATP-grasp enzyme